MSSRVLNEKYSVSKDNHNKLFMTTSEWENWMFCIQKNCVYDYYNKLFEQLNEMEAKNSACPLVHLQNEQMYITLELNWILLLTLLVHATDMQVN